MEERKNTTQQGGEPVPQQEVSRKSNKESNRNESGRNATDPGKEAAAKTERKGAGQQQQSGGNPVVNS